MSLPNQALCLQLSPSPPSAQPSPPSGPPSAASDPISPTPTARSEPRHSSSLAFTAPPRSSRPRSAFSASWTRLIIPKWGLVHAYIDMIDQTTLGHRYIKEQFNVTPRIGWQIDSFGHSAVQAYLMGAEVSDSKELLDRALCGPLRRGYDARLQSHGSRQRRETSMFSESRLNRCSVLMIQEASYCSSAPSRSSYPTAARLPSNAGLFLQNPNAVQELRMLNERYQKVIEISSSAHSSVLICKLLFLCTKSVFVSNGGMPALKRRTRESAQAKIRKIAEKLLLNHLQLISLGDKIKFSLWVTRRKDCAPDRLLIWVGVDTFLAL